jgi:primosomal protein N' (replication factor Y)
LKYYEIVLLRSSAPNLTYAFNEKVNVGSVVSVPLKSTLKDAIVVEEVHKPEFDTAQITSVSDRYYTPEQMQIAKFISEYYFSSFSEAISLFLPHRRSGCPLPDNNLQKEVSVINVGERTPRPTLTSMQQKAYQAILKKDKSLLFGVTGSGKTEIFISLMAKMMEEGKTSIFLMPEISLTPQMEKRLKVYFGDSVAMWHSKLSKKKKESILEGIEEGSIRIIAGARSALFVPLSNLGLIIVDEEHDDSYKAMTRPRYHARDVAVLMGQKLGTKVLLASATPSMGSYHKYDVVKLDKPFVETKKKYEFITGSSLNHTMLNSLYQHYKAGNQALLFLPTRGNFKYLYCESCGKTHLCPYCSVGMALHRSCLLYHI